jgi:hypothetical protein
MDVLKTERGITIIFKISKFKFLAPVPLKYILNPRTSGKLIDEVCWIQPG